MPFDWGAVGAVLFPRSYNNLQNYRQEQQKKAAQEQLPTLNAKYPALVDYAQKTGDTDPFFYNDPASREVLKEQGFVGDISPFAGGTEQNPYLAAAKTEMAQKAQNQADVSDYYAGKTNPDLLARITAYDGTKPHIAAIRGLASDYQAQQAPVGEDQSVIVARNLGLPDEQAKQYKGMKIPELISVIKEGDLLGKQKSLSDFEQDIRKMDLEHTAGNGYFGEIGKPGTFEPALTKAVREIQAKYPGNPLVAKYADEYIANQLKRQETMPWDTKQESLSVGSGDERATSLRRFQINSGGREIPGSAQTVTSHARPMKMPMPGRLVQAYDKNTRDLVFVGADEVKADPQRYAPASQQMKVNQQETLIEDIRGTLNNTMQSLDRVPSFNSKQQAQIALMLKERDPQKALDSFIGSKVGQTLTPEQVDYITDLAVLKENILAMRSLLGGGQSSRDQRAAIEATIPAAVQPNKAFAKVQLNKALRTLDRLSRGVPNADLKPEKSVVERRKGKDGKILVKYSDGSIGKEVKPEGGDSRPVAPAGTKARLTNGKVVTSDGRGGWN
ncbi:hypothetical protein L4X63_20435 [Geomonas sp. Red32]|uniref:hypothetical protein n=1 Tax=Geomonas sp. Red32 TaxID=2912856 RepID=UPI00202CFD83|nr:hypothetical protein [Geomonas sp. Red32]MCM0083954.1 hypothetical protein [Geomonas sp. Red32]